MYLYVPNASIRHFLDNPKNYYFGDGKWLHWHVSKGICEQWFGTSNYQIEHCIRFLKDFKYYSPKKIQFVPVRGRQFPVAMFECTKVE